MRTATLFFPYNNVIRRSLESRNLPPSWSIHQCLFRSHDDLDACSRSSQSNSASFFIVRLDLIRVTESLASKDDSTYTKFWTCLGNSRLNCTWSASICPCSQIPLRPLVSSRHRLGSTILLAAGVTSAFTFLWVSWLKECVCLRASAAGWKFYIPWLCCFNLSLNRLAFGQLTVLASSPFRW